MADAIRTVETQQVTTTLVRKVDCFRKIKNEEGKVEVKRWVDERQVNANLQVVDKGKGGVFRNGARIA